jgi:hypothetical protein
MGMAMDRVSEIRTRLQAHRVAYSAVLRTVEAQNIRIADGVIALLEQFAKTQGSDEAGVYIKDELREIIKLLEKDFVGWKPVVIAGGKEAPLTAPLDRLV